jgi:small GTP-binding protein
MSKRIRNLGILAHVDAGKTTVTENMLYLSGAIRSVGNVDKGTSLSDGLEVEKRRGISVRATTMSFEWKDVQINLIDTPGHVDFAAEVERSMRVLDCAILVLSAVEGVQAHTVTIWDALKALEIPVILFINKVDRMGADAAAVFQDLKQRFSVDVALMSQVIDEGSNEASIASVEGEGLQQLVESVAAKDDGLLERYLNEDTFSLQDLEETIAGCVPTRDLFPVLCGVAKNSIGVESLLDKVITYFPDAGSLTDAPPSGVVFRLDHDAKLGRIAGVRLYAGELQNRDTIVNVTAGREEKITQIKRSLGARYEDTGVLKAGEIGFICGMPDVQIGDVLGDSTHVPGNYRLGEPLLSVQAIPEDEADHTKLTAALQQLSSEDPHLNFTWFDDERELHVKIMGAIQTEILTEILATRFGIPVRFSDPTGIYKETPASSGYGVERYTMPKPCWAIVKYLIEPGEPGSGVSYSSKVGVNDIKIRFQKEIDRSIAGSLKQGIKGWEVTDLKITLVEGSDHVQHSRAGNFTLATNIAMLKGLTETDTILLEPILSFRIQAPESFVGKITSDIIAGRGTFDPAEMDRGNVVLTGRIPLATSMDFPIRLNSMTSGTAKFAFHYAGYEPCPPGEGVVRPYKGISPLDRSKYILKMRGAITEAV